MYTYRHLYIIISYIYYIVTAPQHDTHINLFNTLYCTIFFTKYIVFNIPIYCSLFHRFMCGFDKV